LRRRLAARDIIQHAGSRSRLGYQIAGCKERICVNTDPRENLRSRTFTTFGERLPRGVLISTQRLAENLCGARIADAPSESFPSRA
jgi:hypothetical protein